MTTTSTMMMPMDDSMPKISASVDESIRKTASPFKCFHCSHGCSSPTSIDTCPFRDTELPNAVSDDLAVHKIDIPRDVADAPWLDARLPYVQVFQEQMGTTKLASGPTSSYYTISASGQEGLEYATNQLHHMFLHATQYVLDHEDELAPLFHLPQSLWPRLQESWTRNRNDIVSARFDFALTPSGIKTYEYNADSASCLFECGHSQDAWAAAARLPGHSNSSTLFAQLVAAWRAKGVEGMLHLLCDDDLEERYHSLYMKSAAEAAGIPCILIVGVDSITYDLEGNVFRDSEGNAIRNVWKTWSWDTVLNQYKANEAQHRERRRGGDEDTPQCRKIKGSTKVQARVQVMDILLHETIRVFEPLWTLLTASKAILPVVSMLHPNHPFLLRSTFDHADVASFTTGYCAKPVMGRTGANVSIFDENHNLISATGGKWDKDNILFQELALLPKYNGKYVQVNCWAIDGAYGGTILRVDESNIIDGNSSMYTMRVVDDHEL
ncbi:unnamed protein product [Aphanomyces euteiches]